MSWPTATAPHLNSTSSPGRSDANRRCSARRTCSASRPGPLSLHFQTAASLLSFSRTNSAPYALPPGRQPKIASSSGGFLVVSNVPKPGQYQITASAEGWIDVIQDGKPLASTAYSGRRDCPDVRKSVRFDLQSGAVTIQVSGVDSKLVKLAILPAE